jgi:hypothetical protein
VLKIKREVTMLSGVKRSFIFSGLFYEQSHTFSSAAPLRLWLLVLPLLILLPILSLFREYSNSGSSLRFADQFPGNILTFLRVSMNIFRHFDIEWSDGSVSQSFQRNIPQKDCKK